MNIGMLLNAPYPTDARVKKEGAALIKGGFGVYLLCLRRPEEAVEEDVGGIRVKRIDAGKNNVSLALWDVRMSLTFIHSKFRNAIREWVAANDISALHVHDLPLTGTALSLRDELGIPVVSDFHENYPEALRTWFAWKRNPIARLKNALFMSPERWTSHERKATLESDRVIAVVDEMKSRLMRDHQARQDQIVVVTNSESSDFLNQPDDPSIYGNLKGNFLMTYSGNIGPHRGVDTVIEAMPYLREHAEINFVIVGSGSPSIMSYLKNLARDNQVQNRVHFFGRQPSEKFMSYMKYADANIIPHKSNGHTDNTIPHKLFQAMMVGKPVIVSSSAPLRRIASATRAGVIFEAGNAPDLAEKVLALYQNRAQQRELGNNGIRATIMGNMNWEHDQKHLIRVYQELFNAAR